MENLEIIKKTDVAYSETFTKDGAAYDLTGFASVTLFVFSDEDDTVALIEVLGTISDAENGVVGFEIDITKTDRSGVFKGHYKFVDGSGEISKTDIFKAIFRDSFDKA